MLELPRFSVLPALSLDGVIHVRIAEGSFDGPAFVSFLRTLVLGMNPWPGKNSVLVLDNCSIHHVEEVVEAVESRFVLLLPGSCMLTPHVT